MVGFKVDIGYYTSPMGPSTTVVTDKDVNFTMLTTEKDYPGGTSAQYNNAFTSNQENYDFWQAFFGPQVTALCGFIFNYSPPTYGITALWFPQFFANAPNLTSTYATNGSRKQFVFFHHKQCYLVVDRTSWASSKLYILDKNFNVLFNQSFGSAAGSAEWIGSSDKVSSYSGPVFYNYKYGEPLNTNLVGTCFTQYRETGTSGISTNLTRPTQFGGFFEYLFNGVVPDFDPERPLNPYEPGGESGPGGGDGTFDNDSDPITDSPLPTISSANTGFTRIYNPTLSQLQDLANYLWTEDSVIQTIWNHIKQYFEDPMQAMIGLNLVPVPVPDAGSKNFALMFIDTGVSMNVAASQFVDVDCGTLDIQKYYGSALDYSPYTKVQVFLPYIGMVTIDTDECMGRTLQVKYRVDIASGSCTAKIFINGNVLYQYSGHCAIPVPLSSGDFSSYISSAISVAQLAGTAALAGSGVLSPPPPVTVTQQTNKTVTNEVRDTARNQATGRQVTTGTHSTTTTENTTKETSTQASFAGLTPQNVTNTVSEVMNTKTHVEHSGSFSGNSGYLGVRYPYVIITRPNMCMPGQYQHFNGFPCMMNLKLGDCSGFTRVQQVELTGLDATNPEQAEILELLKMGVYL